MEMGTSLSKGKLILAVAGTILFAAGCFAASEPKGMKLATTPLSGLDEQTGWRKFWKPRYEQKLAQAEKEGKQIQIVFVGDSITNFWEARGKKVFDERFAPYHTLNLGFSGDRTQQMLWIIEKSGIWALIHPKLVVMMIGTNNLGWKESGPEATIEGIRLALAALRKQAPDAKIVLFAIFPRGRDSKDPYRKDIETINRAIAKFADGKIIFFENINAKLMNPDGTIGKDMMPDYLHPTQKGYLIWADAIEPYVQKYVK